eukprot:121930-Amorphochlora_amoeboformis.AAC.3
MVERKDKLKNITWTFHQAKRREGYTHRDKKLKTLVDTRCCGAYTSTLSSGIVRTTDLHSW